MEPQCPAGDRGVACVPLRSAGGLQGSTLRPPGVCLRGHVGGLHPRRQGGQAACSSGLPDAPHACGQGRHAPGRGEHRWSRGAPRPPSWESKDAGRHTRSQSGTGQETALPIRTPDLLPELSTGLLKAAVARNWGVQAPIWKVSFPLSKTKDLKQTRPVESFLSKPASQRGILIQPSASSTSCPPGFRMQKSQRQREPRGSGNLGSRAKDPPRCFLDTHCQKPPTEGVPLSCLGPKLRPRCISRCLGLAGP